MNFDRNIRILIAGWIGVTCPWDVIIAFSWVTGFVGKAFGVTPASYYVFLKSHGSVIAPFVVALVFGGGFFLGRGVFRNERIAIKTARILVAVGMGYDLFWVSFYLYLFVRHALPVTDSGLSYLCKFVVLLIANYLVFKHLVRVSAASRQQT